MQLELAAPVEGRLCRERGLHAGALRQQRPGYRQQHDRAGPVRSVRHREGSRTRSERRQAPVRSQCDVRCAIRPRAQARRRRRRLGECTLWRVDSLDDCAGAQRPAPDAVLQQLLHDDALEHRQTARRARQLLLLRVAAGPDQGSEYRRIARRVLRPDGVRHSGRTASWGTQRRAVCSVRALGWRTLASTRTSSRTTASGCSSRPSWTTPSTTRSSFLAMGPVSPSSIRFLVDGDANNGTHGGAGGRHDSQRGRVLPRTRHTIRHTRHILAGLGPAGPRPA